MTNTQHTPGPWDAEPDALGEFSVSSKDGGTIADVYGRNPANARLTAACPEMLDALIDAESAMFHVRADGGFATAADRQAMDDAWSAARAAIAKATAQ